MTYPQTKGPVVRPMVLLWTLFCISAGAVIFFAAHAWNVNREVSILNSRERALRDAAEKRKEEIRSETDIESLRSLALKHSDSQLLEWQDYRYRMGQLSQGLAFAVVGLAVVCLALAYAIYGLRVQSRAKASV